MTRSFIGDVWFDLYDSVAMLQTTSTDQLSLGEENALTNIIATLDLNLPKWHDRLMEDLLENLNPEEVADMLKSLEFKDNDDDPEEE